MSEYLTNKFDSFNNQNVLIIGDVMIDAYLWGNVDRISPEAPVPILNIKKRESSKRSAKHQIFRSKSYLMFSNRKRSTPTIVYRFTKGVEFNRQRNYFIRRKNN